jgi:hypothetical protein
VLLLVVAAILGFAAEPSTSTQADIGKDRPVVAVRAVQSTAQAATQAARPDRLPALAVVLAALGLGVAAVTLARRPERAANLLPRRGRALLPHRGPPALV